MGIVAEWQAFGAFAVEWLGMPEEAMPFFERGRSGSRKARQICRVVLDAGNFGHNRDNTFRQKSFLVRSAVSTWRYTCDTFRYLFVFPKDSLKVWGRMAWNGVRGVRGSD